MQSNIEQDGPRGSLRLLVAVCERHVQQQQAVREAEQRLQRGWRHLEKSQAHDRAGVGLVRLVEREIAWAEQYLIWQEAWLGYYEQQMVRAYQQLGAQYRKQRTAENAQGAALAGLLGRDE
jgi:hypothetical protein